MNKRIRIIGVPLDLGAGRRGVDMGPSALRVADIDGQIRKLGLTVEDAGDLRVILPETVDFGAKNLRFVEPVVEVNQLVRHAVLDAFEEGCMPLVLGGDHSVAIGSLAASAGHMQRRGEKLGVIWMDAHADMNTPDTTPSGNIHGMSLAIALGYGDPKLTAVAGGGGRLDPRHVALVGIRDLDPGEREHIRSWGCHAFTIRDVDERGMAAVMKDAIRVASDGTGGVHLQLDMDVVDPEEAPGTGTPVPGGISYREAHLAMEMLADSGRLIAADILEINPILGMQNQTAQLAVELILSALGKRIL